MAANSRVVDAAMGYDRGRLRDRLLRVGAVACGTSGLGPAWAAIGARDRVADLLQELPTSEGERRRVKFRPDDRTGGET